MVDFLGLCRAELHYGPLVPVGLAYRLFDVSRSYFYRLAASGKFSRIMVKGSATIPLRELQAWDEERGKK